MPRKIFVVGLLTIATIALVRVAGVGQDKSNPDGEYPNPSSDFSAQCAASPLPTEALRSTSQALVAANAWIAERTGDRGQEHLH